MGNLMLTTKFYDTYTWQTSRSYVLKIQQIQRLPTPHADLSITKSRSSYFIFVSLIP